MNSEDLRSTLVNQVISDKVVVAGNIGTLNMGDTVLLPTPNQLPPDIKFFSGRANEKCIMKVISKTERSLQILAKYLLMMPWKILFKLLTTRKAKFQKPFKER
ncbi:MAG: hypothetical protein IPN87_19330 [Saprospiraceae bacterium]|nr:hypothetical protein [Candidatus Brachybacter algidus]